MGRATWLVLATALRVFKWEVFLPSWARVGGGPSKMPSQAQWSATFKAVALLLASVPIVSPTITTDTQWAGNNSSVDLVSWDVLGLVVTVASLSSSSLIHGVFLPGALFGLRHPFLWPNKTVLNESGRMYPTLPLPLGIWFFQMFAITKCHNKYYMWVRTQKRAHTICYSPLVRFFSE